MDDLAAVVLRARDMLKNGDGKTPASELQEALRAVLAPLMLRKAALSEGAVQKLGEINAALDGASDIFIGEQRDALDLLLLGLWIRLELSAETSRDD